MKVYSIKTKFVSLFVITTLLFSNSISYSQSNFTSLSSASVEPSSARQWASALSPVRAELRAFAESQRATDPTKQSTDRQIASAAHQDDKYSKSELRAKAIVKAVPVQDRVQEINRVHWEKGDKALKRSLFSLDKNDFEENQAILVVTREMGTKQTIKNVYLVVIKKTENFKPRDINESNLLYYLNRIISIRQWSGNKLTAFGENLPFDKSEANNPSQKLLTQVLLSVSWKIHNWSAMTPGGFEGGTILKGIKTIKFSPNFSKSRSGKQTIDVLMLKNGDQWLSVLKQDPEYVSLSLLKQELSQLGVIDKTHPIWKQTESDVNQAKDNIIRARLLSDLDLIEQSAASIEGRKKTIITARIDQVRKMINEKLETVFLYERKGDIETLLSSLKDDVKRSELRRQSVGFLNRGKAFFVAVNPMFVFGYLKGKGSERRFDYADIALHLNHVSFQVVQLLKFFVDITKSFTERTKLTAEILKNDGPLAVIRIIFSRLLNFAHAGILSIISGSVNIKNNKNIYNNKLIKIPLTLRNSTPYISRAELRNINPTIIYIGAGILGAFALLGITIYQFDWRYRIMKARYPEIVKRLESEIPFDPRHYNHKDKVDEFLPIAVRFFKQGYDFEIVYIGEEFYMGAPDESGIRERIITREHSITIRKGRKLEFSQGKGIQNQITIHATIDTSRNIQKIDIGEFGPLIIAPLLGLDQKAREFLDSNVFYRYQTKSNQGDHVLILTPDVKLIFLGKVTYTDPTEIIELNERNAALRAINAGLDLQQRQDPQESGIDLTNPNIRIIQVFPYKIPQSLKPDQFWKWIRSHYKESFLSETVTRLPDLPNTGITISIDSLPDLSKKSIEITFSKIRNELRSAESHKMQDASELWGFEIHWDRVEWNEAVVHKAAKATKLNVAEFKKQVLSSAQALGSSRGFQIDPLERHLTISSRSEGIENFFLNKVGDQLRVEVDFAVPRHIEYLLHVPTSFRAELRKVLKVGGDQKKTTTDGEDVLKSTDRVPQARLPQQLSTTPTSWTLQKIPGNRLSSDSPQREAVRAELRVIEDRGLSIEETLTRLPQSDPTIALELTEAYRQMLKGEEGAMLEKYTGLAANGSFGFEDVLKFKDSLKDDVRDYWIETLWTNAIGNFLVSQKPVSEFDAFFKTVPEHLLLKFGHSLVFYPKSVDMSERALSDSTRSRKNEVIQRFRDYLLSFPELASRFEWLLNISDEVKRLSMKLASIDPYGALEGNVNFKAAYIKLRNLIEDGNFDMAVQTFGDVNLDSWQDNNLAVLLKYVESYDGFAIKKLIKKLHGLGQSGLEEKLLTVLLLFALQRVVFSQTQFDLLIPDINWLVNLADNWLPLRVAIIYSLGEEFGINSSERGMVRETAHLLVDAKARRELVTQLKRMANAAETIKDSYTLLIDFLEGKENRDTNRRAELRIAFEELNGADGFSREASSVLNHVLEKAAASQISRSLPTTSQKLGAQINPVEARAAQLMLHGLGSEPQILSNVLDLIRTSNGVQQILLVDNEAIAKQVTTFVAEKLNLDVKQLSALFVAIPIKDARALKSFLVNQPNLRELEVFGLSRGADSGLYDQLVALLRESKVDLVVKPRFVATVAAFLNLRGLTAKMTADEAATAKTRMSA